MKAITFRQPGASLIVAGATTWSFGHNWFPEKRYWGERIVIHSSQPRPVPRDYLGLLDDLVRGTTWSLGPGGDAAKAIEILKRYRLLEDNLPTGSVIGSVRLGVPVQCKTVTDIVARRPIEAERGKWLFSFSEPLVFPDPLPCRGDRGLWTWNGDERRGLNGTDVPAPRDPSEPTPNALTN